MQMENKTSYVFTKCVALAAENWYIQHIRDMLDSALYDLVGGEDFLFPVKCDRMAPHLLYVSFE